MGSLQDEMNTTSNEFKEYVHARLDHAGVPYHPEGPHGAHGCRIGDRLDWLFRQSSQCADHAYNRGMITGCLIGLLVSSLIVMIIVMMS